MTASSELIYFSPFSSGGLADYAHEQATALVEMGVKVRFLTTPRAALAKPNVRYQRKSILNDEPNRITHPSKLARRIQTTRCILSNIRTLADYIQAHRIKRVLFSAYFEYFAPLWASRLRMLAMQDVVFGSVVHDPLRNFVVGPLWWHRWSTACGYSFLREAFVHEPMELPTVRPMPRLRTTVIPHGPYDFPRPSRPRNSFRSHLGIPERAILLLAFGHIRDSKNLDLVLEAMAQCPEFYLLVAGQELGSSQRPVSYYRRRADELNIAHRCRWDIRHIPQGEMGNYFEAADLIALTYSGSFVSASGVLSAAANFRKPCLASSGPGNLKTIVEKYSLGVWIEPDSSEVIAKGLKKYLKQTPTPNWSRYLEDNSWRRNAELVASRLCPEKPVKLS